MRAVMALREKAGLRNFHRMLLIHPELYLAEPALFRHAYEAPPNGSGDAAARGRSYRAAWRSLLCQSNADGEGLKLGEARGQQRPRGSE